MAAQPEERTIAIYQAMILVVGAVLWAIKVPRLLQMPEKSLLEVTCLCLMIVLASAKAVMIPLPSLKFITGRGTCVTAADAIILFMLVVYGDAPTVCAAGIDGFIGSRGSLPATHARRRMVV